MVELDFYGLREQKKFQTTFISNEILFKGIHYGMNFSNKKCKNILEKNMKFSEYFKCYEKLSRSQMRISFQLKSPIIFMQACIDIKIKK